MQHYKLGILSNSFVGAQAKRANPDTVKVSDKGTLVRDVLIDYIKKNGLPR